MDEVVSPLLHKYSDAGVADRDTLPPSQNVVVPSGVIVAIGFVFTVTAVVEEVASQPFASVIVTEKLPLAFTKMDEVVSPLLHKYSEAAVADNVTSPPSQNVVDPSGVIVAIGFGFTSMCIGSEIAEQSFFVSVTE